MKIETKYHVGQKLWSISGDKVQEFTIDSAVIHVGLNYETMKPREPSAVYKLRKGDSARHRIECYKFELSDRFYLSKQDLINSL